MTSSRHVARDISYASSAKSRKGRAFVRTVENLTGRPKLIRRVQGYEAEIALGRSFWDVMVERYELHLNIVRGALKNIPKDGPVILVANHPYGILDGMILGQIMSNTRGDFRVLANHVFKNSKDLERVILPINFDGTKEGIKQNLKTRDLAVDYLKGGGCIGIFPGGTVSTAKSRKHSPMDPVWRNFTAKLIKKSGATVVPIFFDGANSKLFQRASRLHYLLRVALLINEFKRRVGDNVDIAIGDPITAADLAKSCPRSTELMDYLRTETYRLSPTPLVNYDYGYEFEKQYI